MTLKRRVFSASLWNLAGNSGQQIISFVIFIYLARQLSPADIGLIALAVVFLDILSDVSRCGQVETLQRHSDLDSRITSTSFWMLTVSGVASGLLVLIAGILLRAYPAYETLGNILMLLAPLSALQAWNATPEAILKHRLDFRVLTLRTWTGTVAGGVVGIYMVHEDMGVYALVGQRLGGAAIRTVLLWLLLRWRPSFVFDRREARQLLGTGFEIMLAGLAGLINMRIADGITGLFLGPQQLGFLRLGWRFYDVINLLAVTPVSSVALSSFSKLRENPENMRRAYLRLTQFIALASLPMLFGLGAIADVLIPAVFGDKWQPAVPVLQLLGLLMLPGTVNCFFAPLMVAQGSTRVVLKQSIAQVFVSALFLAVGARWGVEGVVAAHILRASLVSAYNLHAMKRAVQVSPLSVLRMLAPSCAAASLMVAVVLAAKHGLSQVLSGLPFLAALIAIGAVAYGAILLAGDLFGPWKGYVGSAVRSLMGALPKGRAA